MMRIVEIDWVDSAAAGGQWECLDTARDMSLASCHSVGYIVTKTKDRVVIAQNLGRSWQSVMNVTVIPRGCIKSIRVIK